MAVLHDERIFRPRARTARAAVGRSTRAVPDPETTTPSRGVARLGCVRKLYRRPRRADRGPPDS